MKPFWWFVAFFVAVNLLWIGPSLLGAGTLEKGSVAPPFDLPLVAREGERITLEEARGATVLLVFWATWCDACVAELPLIARMAEEYSGRGLRVIGMNIEPDDRLRVARFLVRRGIEFPNAAVDGATSSAYRVKILPSIVIVDKTGRVCRSRAGRTGRLRLGRAVESCL